MGALASQITSLTIVYSIVYSDDQGKHQSSASLAFLRGIHQRTVNSPHKWPVTRKMFPFDDVIMLSLHPAFACWWPGIVRPEFESRIRHFNDLNKTHIVSDHFYMHAPSQWETTLHSNVVYHWLGASKKWSHYSPRLGNERPTINNCILL